MAGGLVLDHEALRDASGYLELGVTLVSPDSRLLAYSVDRTGDEVYALRFRDIASGTDLPEEVPGSYYGGAWTADSSHFFYTVLNAAYRPHEVWRHAARDARVRRRAGAQRARRAIRAERPGVALGRPGADLVREPGHHRGVGRSTRATRGTHPGRSAAGGSEWSTTPSTPCCRTARRCCCS